MAASEPAYRARACHCQNRDAVNRVFRAGDSTDKLDEKQCQSPFKTSRTAPRRQGPSLTVRQPPPSMPRIHSESVQEMTTLPFYPAVPDDFEAVNQLIMRQLHSRVPLVEKIGSYIISAGGKRLRPLVVLLGARACGLTDARPHTLAAIIEFMHTSTLLHDDVVDTSELRRGRSTANALWGNAASVLVGDFLYSRSFELMVELDDMRIMRVLASATNVIAEGEVLQLSKVRDASTDEATYMEVIRSKTAMLFEASTHTA